jgi:hypothetical protein
MGFATERLRDDRENTVVILCPLKVLLKGKIKAEN